MSLPGEYDASTGFLEKSRDGLSDAGTSFVHQFLNLHAASECGLLCAPHLRRRQNWQVQSTLPI
jgi:hypothetical protein